MEKVQCCDCGHEWVKGQHGGHSCVAILRQKLEAAESEIKRAVLAKAPNQIPIYQVQTSGGLWLDVDDDTFEFHDNSRKLYASPPQAAAISELVERIAHYVEIQEGGPFDPKVLAAAIRGNYEYGNKFESETQLKTNSES